MDQIEASETAETPINFKEYFYLLWSWAWLILLVGALAGAAAYIVSMRTVPIYETSTRLLISDPPIIRSLDTNAMISGQTMTSTYAEMLVDRPVLQGVVDKFKLPMTSDQLKRYITVDTVRNTQLILVTVQHPDPKLAADIANTIAQVFTARIRDLQAQRYSAAQKGLSEQVTEMEKQVNETTVAIAKESNSAQKLQLEARLTEYRQLYANLVTNYEQARLAEAQTSTNVFVSEPASISSEPVSPKTAQNTLLAIVAGMLLAAGAVIVMDILDDTIKNPDEVRVRFKVPVLGMIAVHNIQEGQPMCQAEPRSPITESFRSLRTNLAYAAIDKPLQRILVTSPTPDEGKTTISANLAVIIAQAEKRVLLLDADLRRPQIHQKFGLLNKVGLTDFFVRPSDAFGGLLQTCDVPRLTIVTSGRLPPNPAELLASQKMEEIFERLGQDHDLIVIDTPPLLSVTDAAALSARTDGVLLVIRPGVTQKGMLEQSLQQLRGVGARILGVVFNQVDPRSRKYGYYYQQYYSKYIQYGVEEGVGKKKKQFIAKKAKGSL